MSSITLVSPGIEHAAAISKLGQETFVETFGHLYKPDDVASFLHDVHGEHKVQQQLADPNRAYRIAADGAAWIGYCQVSKTTALPLDLPTRRMFELKQLYLRSGYSGRRIADALMAWAIQWARAHGADDLLLSVFSENPRAQRFYQRHGFSQAGDYYFEVGAQRDYEFIYRLPLSAV